MVQSDIEGVMDKEVDDMSHQKSLKGLQLYINPDECILCGACTRMSTDNLFSMMKMKAIIEPKVNDEAVKEKL